MLCGKYGAGNPIANIILSAPIIHTLSFNTIPSLLGTILDMDERLLKRIIYFHDYVVVGVKSSECPLRVGQILTGAQCNDYAARYIGKFQLSIGGNAIKQLLTNLDIKSIRANLESKLNTLPSNSPGGKEIYKRLRLFELFSTSNDNTKRIVLDTIPISSSHYLEGNDLNMSGSHKLYLRLINANSYLKKLIELNAPEVILRYRKKMLQKAFDAFFNNLRCKMCVDKIGLSLYHSKRRRINPMISFLKKENIGLEQERYNDELNDLLNKVDRGENNAMYNLHLFNVKHYLKDHDELKKTRPKITNLAFAQYLIILALKENPASQEAKDLFEKIELGLQEYKKVYPNIVEEQIALTYKHPPNSGNCSCGKPHARSKIASKWSWCSRCRRCFLKGETIYDKFGPDLKKTVVIGHARKGDKGCDEIKTEINVGTGILYCPYDNCDGNERENSFLDWNCARFELEEYSRLDIINYPEVPERGKVYSYCL